MNNFKKRLERIKDRIYRNLEGLAGEDDKMTASEIAQGLKLLEVNAVLAEPIEPGDASKYLEELENDEDLPSFDTPPDVLPN